MAVEEDDVPVEQLLGTVQAAALARRKPGTIRQWANRGHLVERRRDARGWPLYAVQDIYAAEKAARDRDESGRSWEAVNRALPGV